ncbi:MAG: DUF3168 domain-containing protein, partial [Pseudomonadota bacterium]
MFAPIFKVCSASSQVTALLGAAPTRLYPFGEAPQGVTYPYAVWQSVGGAPENFLAGRPDADNYTTQVDVYAESAASAREVAKALRDAVELDAYVVAWRG